MFNDKKLFITGGTGSIGNSICHYFHENKCSNIFASTTNLEKISSSDSFINYKKLNLI
jgi:FlaA1/EpsC-like NDP-sugar epimerase